jgi:DnaK suppressor protein
MMRSSRIASWIVALIGAVGLATTAIAADEPACRPSTDTYKQLGRPARIAMASGTCLPGRERYALLMTQHTSPHLSDADLHHFRVLLSRKRDDLVAARAAIEADRRGPNDHESEEGDLAEQVIEQDSALRISAFDQALLDDVERALAKVEAGTYGRSEATGEPIPRERLEAMPWARGTVHEAR